MFSIRFNRWTIAAIALAALAAARRGCRRRRPNITGDNAAQFPSKTDLKSLTTSGSYLAARHASVERDASFGRGVLSLGAAHRPEEQRTARPRLHLLAGGWRHRRGGQARRPHPDDGQVQPRRAAGGRRARSEAEEICRRADQHQPVDPRADHRSGRDAAVGLGQLRRRRRQGGGRQYRQADRAGMVSDLQGPPHRHDPRDLAARKRTPATRFERAYKLDDSMLRVSDAYARWLSRNKDARGGDRHLRGLRQEAAAASAGAGGPARDQGRQEAAAAGRFARRPARPRRCTASARR